MRPSERVQRVRDILLTEGLNPHRVETALRHSEQWVAVNPPPNSLRSEPVEDEMDAPLVFNPIEADESKERARVSRLAAKGLTEIPRLAKLLHDTATSLLEFTDRLTAAPEIDVETWCAHHKNHGFSEPLGARPRHGNCGWCDDFRREYKALPPKAVLAMRDRQGRVTVQFIAESLKRAS